MPKNASIKIEVFDPETGGRVTVIVDGAVPKSLSESIGKYISGVLSSRRASAQDEPPAIGGASEARSVGSVSFSSMFEKLRFLLVKHFKYGSFTSRDVQDEYERVFEGRLRGSTVSTYLLRLADPKKGILERRHSGGGYEYLLRGERMKNDVVLAEKTRPLKSPTI